MAVSSYKQIAYERDMVLRWAQVVESESGGFHHDKQELVRALRGKIATLGGVTFEAAAIPDSPQTHHEGLG